MHDIFCFANILNPDQAHQNKRSDQDPNCLVLWSLSWKKFFGKVISLRKRQTIKTFKIILYSQREIVFSLFNVIIFIIPIIIFLNLSKFLKIQTKSSPTKWLESLTNSDQPAHWSMQTAKTLTIQCLYPVWSESRLFVHESANSSQSPWSLDTLATHYVAVKTLIRL